ncbi:hypothetical protein JVT61DRAFT_12191 [Boletus reticuloceps]|uniref:Uncharacterized protein n=1 Tax=Boletus reticuloceps TaxID=495285 RepID=A0A8I2YEA0_9AGAM|nr:hypothetical protein JVT61DRAFT_12191 [Boletus reticuloceps]
MEKGRTPDEDLALSSDLNITRGKLSVCSYLDHPSPVFSCISYQFLTPFLSPSPLVSLLLIFLLQRPGLLRATYPIYARAILLLTPQPRIPVLLTPQPRIPVLLPIVIPAFPRLPPPSSLSHPHFAQYHSRPSSSEHLHQPPATSCYLPSTSTSAPTNRPSSATPSSTSPMIISALSFYDPAQASAIPDYHHLSRWDAPFDPCLTIRSHPVIRPSLPRQLALVFNYKNHRASVPSDGSHLLPQQHRQIVPIPRRQKGLHQHDPTEREGRVQTHPLPSRQGLAQTEQHEQRSQTQEAHTASHELANQRLQELLSLTPSYAYTSPQRLHSHTNRTQGQSREHATAFPTSQDQPSTSDAGTAPVEYQIQGTSLSSALDFVTTQNHPYPRTTPQYIPSTTGLQADVGIPVEHVNEPSGLYYNVHASHSISSLVRPILLYYLLLLRAIVFHVYIRTRRVPISNLIYNGVLIFIIITPILYPLPVETYLVVLGQHHAYPLASPPYPQAQRHSSPHSTFSAFTPSTHSNTPASDTGESWFRHTLRPPFGLISIYPLLLNFTSHVGLSLSGTRHSCNTAG